GPSNSRPPDQRTRDKPATRHVSSDYLTLSEIAGGRAAGIPSCRNLRSSKFHREAPMRRLNAFALTTTFALGVVAAAAIPARAQAPAGGVTAFQGARLIVGDGRAPIQNATVRASCRPAQQGAFASPMARRA